LIFIFTLFVYAKGLLAQRLEQSAHNALVVGSIPTGPTTFLMKQSDTIFSAITSVGGSVITIRISGNNALDVKQILDVKDWHKIQPNKTFLTKIIIDNQVLDEVLLTYFEHGKSFTGEDVIEISIHGSVAILKELLINLGKINNFRFAEKGEFTKRAFLNGKIDLIQAESIHQLVKSETLEQVRISHEFLSGKASKQYEKIRENLVQLLSNFETLIDFSDEDIPASVAENMHVLKEELATFIQKKINNKDQINKIFNGISVAIIGKPNAGKSSLMNALTQKDTSIISNIAGTTRDIVKDEIIVDNVKIHLYDTAGIREFSNDEIEKIGIEKTKKILNTTNMNIIIVDTSDFNIHEYEALFSLIAVQDLLILNKTDLTTAENISQIRNKILNKFKNIQNIITTSIKNDDIDEIINFLKQNVANFNSEDSIALNERHFVALNRINEILLNLDVSKNADYEIEAEKIYKSLSIIENITGKIYNDDILANIFSNFCIGK
jgi:tRNA modification GTPase